eukprot:TRINITY_DN5223_c0_g1_i1.p1 TRINITY_DN5223_c0_g1~~TRINITY_DN5223_c0_g1_i1.p1  ORF type:complete len:141 (+),score=23.53 TRINITY_DN5223_c0_g1_i1:184-606(+)
MAKDRIEIYGLAETSSRMSLKKTMESFGEVIGCHIGSRGVDYPVVRFQTTEGAESALSALKNKQVYVDGLILDGDWKGSKQSEGSQQKGRGNYDDEPIGLTSRELYLDRDRDRERDRVKSRRSASRERRRRSRSRRRRRD